MFASEVENVRSSQCIKARKIFIIVDIIVVVILHWQLKFQSQICIETLSKQTREQNSSNRK